MKKRTDTDIKEQAPTFEELEAAWRRHMEHVERRVREQAPGRDEATARLARWYAGQRSVRRRDRVTLVALGVCAAVAVGGAGWWLLPRQEPRQPLTACEPPLPEALQIAVEPAPAPASPSVPARRQRVRTLPAPAALPEADEAPCATALLPDDGGDPAGTPSQSYSNMLCNNSCNSDNVIEHIHFHYAGLPDENLG